MSTIIVQPLSARETESVTGKVLHNDYNTARMFGAYFAHVMDPGYSHRQALSQAIDMYWRRRIKNMRDTEHSSSDSAIKGTKWSVDFSTEIVRNKRVRLSMYRKMAPHATDTIAGFVVYRIVYKCIPVQI